MNRKIRVLVCDDHALFREGVKTVLQETDGIEVVGEAGDGSEALDQTRRLHPDVVLMDISMPLLRGSDAIRRIHKLRPGTKVLMLTVYDDEDVVARCMEAGAAGYLLKDAPLSQLAYAIQAVFQGEQYMSPKALQSVFTHFVQHKETPASGYDLLSDRERQILVLLAEGSSLKEIAGRLNLSVKTVDAHKYRIMRKLDVHDRAGLIRYAIRKKLVEA